MRTIKLLLAYDGTDFHGWQLQPDAPTIQGEIEKHLATIHEQHIVVHGAGRTDAGVHAVGMVAHFHTEKTLSSQAFQQALNSMLPTSIRVLEASEVDDSFHSRFSAISKTYTYSIFNGDMLLPHKRLYTLHVRPQLDFAVMKTCLKSIEGTHDFSSFEAAGSRDQQTRDLKGSTRTIYRAEIEHHNEGFHTFVLTGSGFLRHMVRNIVGTTLEAGLGRRSVSSFTDALLAKNRSASGSTAPAHGLTLTKIDYKQQTAPINK